MKILVCLPVCASIPREALPGTVCIRTNSQKFGLWGKVYEDKGAQRVRAMFQGIEPTTYVFWMVSSSSHVCSTAQNNAACSHFRGFSLPATFLRVYTPLSHRAVCLGGSFLAPASLGRAVMPTLKDIKKRRDRDIFIIEVHLKKDKSCSPRSWKGGGCPPACLCFVRQVRSHV